MSKNTDTIAAISTAVSESGIGIIRISGEEAFEIADRVFQFPKKKSHGQKNEAGLHDEAKPQPGSEDLPGLGGKTLAACPSHTIHYGYICDGDELVDEVLVSVFRAPRSYTVENTVEINCHGGVYAMRRVLETVLRAGARPARPGEFTRRAFLNGRLDLSSAEAVMDVISSGNRFALQNSLGQLKGSLRREIQALRKEILHEMAVIESALDDPEHYSLDGYGAGLLDKNEKWISRMAEMVRSFHDGRILSEGVKTVILGKPNAGKSSLLNALIGEERAIVSRIPGTTRDTIQEKISLGEISLHMIDTAGIRSTADEVENIGIERAVTAAENADLCLVVIDSSEMPDADDEKIIRMTADKQCIYLLNKTDKPGRITSAQLQALIDRCIAKKRFENSHSMSENRIVEISASEGTGLEILKEQIREIFYSGKITFNDQVVITNSRHKDALMEAKSALENVREALMAGLPEDLLTIDLMSAYTSLGEITGEQVGEDLINEIFDKFCMGK